MITQRSGPFRRIYGIALSAVLVITGLCLMVQCCSIYFTGDGSFSPEIVAAHFAPIAIPAYLCLVMVILALVLELLLPGEAGKRSVEKNHSLILEKLHARIDLSQCDSSLSQAVAKEQKARKCHKIVSILLLILGSLIFLSYALNGEHFHQRDITPSLIRAMYCLVPCMAVPFGYAVFTAYHNRRSIQREIALLKTVAPNRSPAPAAAAAPRKAEGLVRWGILVLAAAFFVYGFLAGGTADVLTKAINICTECVGLG